MKILLAQRNPKVGDIEGNLKKLVVDLKNASSNNVDLIIYPELFLTGYPPLDLLNFKHFIEDVDDAIEEICLHSKEFPELGILVGAPIAVNGKLYNSAVFISDGKILFMQHKTNLPNYDVFDEKRFFCKADSIDILKFKNEILGITICEDAWIDEEYNAKQSKGYSSNPLQLLKNKGATLLINMSASPFEEYKHINRLKLFKKHANSLKLPILYINQVGANDQLIFDGNSFCVNQYGELTKQLIGFEEELGIYNLNIKGKPIATPPYNHIEQVYKALCLGVADYVKKTGFKQLVLGLSGGIDSAVTCAIAAAACGSKNVLGILMPSEFSSAGSVTDAKELAVNLKINYDIIKINTVLSMKN